MPLVASSLDHTYSHTVEQVMFTQTFCSIFWHPSKRRFLHRHDVRCTTNMMEHFLISVTSSGTVRMSSSLKDGSVAALHRIGHHGHRFSTRYVTVCVGLHESYCVCTQGEHGRGTISENKTSVLCKVRCSLVTQDRKCIQASGRHFGRPARILLCIFVTVYLTTVSVSLQCNSFLSNLLSVL
jgi:hypothetical protein